MTAHPHPLPAVKGRSQGQGYCQVAVVSASVSHGDRHWGWVCELWFCQRWVFMTGGRRRGGEERRKGVLKGGGGLMSLQPLVVSSQNCEEASFLHHLSILVSGVKEAERRIKGGREGGMEWVSFFADPSVSLLMLHIWFYMSAPSCLFLLSVLSHCVDKVWWI